MLAPAFAVAIAVTAIQQLMGSIIEPAFVGQSLNLSPLAVILPVVFRGSLWGIIGAFLCVPLTTILAIILSNFPSTRWVSVLLSQTGALSDTVAAPAGQNPGAKL